MHQLTSTISHEVRDEVARRASDSDSSDDDDDDDDSNSDDNSDDDDDDDSDSDDSDSDSDSDDDDPPPKSKGSGSGSVITAASDVKIDMTNKEIVVDGRKAILRENPFELGAPDRDRLIKRFYIYARKARANIGILKIVNLRRAETLSSGIPKKLMKEAKVWATVSLYITLALPVLTQCSPAKTKACGGRK